MTDPQVPAEQAPDGSPHNLASWGTRAVGLIIDWVPLLIVNALLFRVSVLASLIGILYWVWMGNLDGVSGQTPGKAMMGIRLVDKDGNLLGAGLGIGRKFVHILDSLICFLGWLLPLVDAKRQTIADKVLNTYVVTGVERKPFAVDLWLAPKGEQA